MKKKVLSVFLVMLIVFSFASCKGEKSDEQATLPDGSQGYVINNGDKAVSLGTPGKKLDPKSVYSSLEYTPEMFYGDYRLVGGKEAEEKFGNDSEYTKIKINGIEYELTKTPYRIRSGKNTTMHSLSKVEDHQWMMASFMQKTSKGNYMYELKCAYTVEGNTLKLKPLDNFNLDSETGKITYTFSDVTLEYDFAFSGRNITLTSGKNSVTMKTGLAATEDITYFGVDNYISQNSKKINGIEHISFRYDDASKNTSLYIDTDKESIDKATGTIGENGLFTFTVPFEAGEKTYQFVYFYCGTDGIVLTDGTDTYYYNLSYHDYNMFTVNKYIGEDYTGKLDDISEVQLEKIVEKKDKLLDHLIEAFADEGIKVSVDKEYGSLAIDSSVIFGGDSAELSADGKDFLNKFIKAYTSIVFTPEYENFVLRTVVEGHTAPLSTSTYESGLPLSEERAEVVKDYCISSETGVDTAKLAKALDAVGYSNSKPIHDDDGNVDMDASRRVSFKFLINLDV